MLVLLKLVFFKSYYCFKELVLFFIVSIKKHFGAPCTCFSTHFLEYGLLFWKITWMKKANNFKIAKNQLQDVA